MMRFLFFILMTIIICFFIFSSVVLAQKINDLYPIKDYRAQISEEKPETIDCYYDIYPEQRKDFEEALKELSFSRDVEVKMMGRPRRITMDDGREKYMYTFTLTGKIEDVEDILNELDRRFEDPLEYRD